MNSDLIGNELEKVTEQLGDHLDGGGEFVRWRHQQLGDRALDSQNAQGMAPGGMTHETDDRHRKAIIGEESAYGQFIPVQGDLIITLHGAPSTKRQAESASPASTYCVKSTPVERRNSTGQLMICEFEISLDRSGQW